MTEKQKYKMDPERALEKVSEMPNIRVTHRIVKDKTGKQWLVTETTITDWTPWTYIDKMLSSQQQKPKW